MTSWYKPARFRWVHAAKPDLVQRIAIGAALTEFFAAASMLQWKQRAVDNGWLTEEQRADREARWRRRREMSKGDCHRCIEEQGGSAMRMILCGTCGNKRCPKADDHRNKCSGSNEPGQIGSAYENPPRNS